MAEPTFPGGVGSSKTVFTEDSRTSQGEDEITNHGYQNFIALSDKAGNEVHIILGTGVPSAVTTYDTAPLGSLYINYAGGDGTSLYVKEAAEAAGVSGWAPVTTGDAA